MPRAEPRLLTSIAALAAAATLAGCPGIVLEFDDDDTAVAEGLLVVEPDCIEFGDLEVGQRDAALVTLYNGGDATLQLRELRVVGAASFDLDDVPADRVLAPHEIYALQVTYAPGHYEVAEGMLRVTTGDTDAPDAEVALSGRGLAPSIRLDPPTWSFDGEPVGCEQQREVAIWNDGTALLTVEGVEFESASGELAESHDFAGTQIEPGHRAEAVVRYLPTDELPDVGYLRVRSDDPGRPEAEAVFSGSAFLGELRSETFVQAPANQTDVLFVIDNSCSMDAQQAALTLALGSFLDGLLAVDADFHLGVVTTDTAALQAPVIDADTDDPDTAFLAAALVGTGGASVEQGLAQALAALTPPLTDPGGPNDGFLRDAGTLQVVFVSDEDDQSDGAVTDYVSAFQALRPDPADVLLHAFVHEGWPGGRYALAASATGGVGACLCDPAWIDDLGGVAELCEDAGATFPLAAVPVADTIEVTVDGVPVPDGWSHDAGLNAIVFEAAYLPDAGAQVTVTYHEIESCSG